VLLGFGLGALIVASQRGRRGDPRSASRAAPLQELAIEAQQISAIASQRARALSARWSDQEARKEIETHWRRSAECAARITAKSAAVKA
jgi:hypothetical protein